VSLLLLLVQKRKRNKMAISAAIKVAKAAAKKVAPKVAKKLAEPKSAVKVIKAGSKPTTQPNRNISKITQPVKSKNKPSTKVKSPTEKQIMEHYRSLYKQWND
jgi:hypothetical protein